MLGALQSALQTIVPLLDRYDTGDAGRREALRATARQLCEAATESVTRLSEIAGRMHRMTNGGVER